jgi:type IV secretion system protein VirB10
MSYMPKANGEGSPGDEYLSQNLQESKREFASTGRNTFTPIVADGDRLPPYVVKAGWDIPAILAQAANSDLPGELRARVRENVYDTATGRYLLIPQNSILVGKYNPDIAYAQNRIQVNWDRLLRPGNEPTIFLNQMNGVDSDGSAGLTGPVNNHYKRLIGFAILSSAFAAGIEASQTHNNSAAYGYPTAGQMAGAAVGTQMGEFGRQITERNLNRPPTILLKPGTRFNVRVNRDMIFVAPYH